MKRVKVEIATVNKRYINSDMTIFESVVGEPIVLEVEVFDDEGDDEARERVRRALQRLVDP